MRRLVYTQAAARDLIAIQAYISHESGSVALGRRFTEHLRQQCHKLATLPGTFGRARPELRPDLRSFAFRNYVIFLRYRSDRLEIINIIEDHRDIEALFDKGGGVP
ncbi:type II toxin-antitoxin system RelE/ParE family toxin [Labrys sp. ZIDIC5]|uniref:type II toxin-antitoxin system RelE/ParE family toxin n=1 Tax=Labrys sedimenti TaxID=3106036 RepID=UPI002ACA781D|nr:type II toxin-antitoxin system RelE/ParE family toxin [Labrys sp. ZIDIC5]MDZ5452768.1 type II toxin-antitoxin system RelE/ParE family toxin [Labrys sp. ZIDIC5]